MAWRPTGIPPEAKISQLVVSRTPDAIHVEATWEWSIGDGPLTTVNRAASRWTLPPDAAGNAIVDGTVEALKPADPAPGA